MTLAPDAPTTRVRTGTPTQPPFSPKLSTQVAEPLMPILCSRALIDTSFDFSSVPSAFARTLGTMKSVSPLVPGGAPSTRASTRWTMSSARS